MRVGPTSLGCTGFAREISACCATCDGSATLSVVADELSVRCTGIDMSAQG